MRGIQHLWGKPFMDAQGCLLRINGSGDGVCVLIACWNENIALPLGGPARVFPALTAACGALPARPTASG